MAYLLSQDETVCCFELFCPICKEKIIIEVPKSLASDEIIYPFEYVDVHGDPYHGITLYIDNQWNVRGIDILRNVCVRDVNN